jgi:hypothetical protein
MHRDYSADFEHRDIEAFRQLVDRREAILVSMRANSS